MGSILYNFSELLFSFCGLTLFAYFANIGCDPFTEGAIDVQNEVSSTCLFFSYQLLSRVIRSKFSPTTKHSKIVILKHILFALLKMYSIMLNS